MTTHQDAAAEPQISIVIPVFNTGKYLADAIASAEAQTVGAAIIVADDGSSDPETLGILTAARSRGVKVIRGDTNRGTPYALNTGVAAAVTPLVCFMGSDDLLEPHLCERVVDVFAERPDIDIVAYDIGLFGDASGVLVTHGAPDGVRSLVFGNTIQGASCIRTEVWHDIGGFRENLAYGEDWDFWLRAVSRAHRVFVIHEPLYRYRQHAAQSGASFSHADKRRKDAAIAELNRDLWAEHIGAIMVDYWEKAAALRRMETHYGRLDRIMRSARKAVLGAQHRLCGVPRSTRAPQQPASSDTND